MLTLLAIIFALALLAWLLTRGCITRDDVTTAFEREVMTQGLRKGGS